MLWLLAGVSATLFCVSHLRVLVEDWVFAAKADSEVLREIAWSYLRREMVRLVQGLLISGIGIYAALEPPARPGPAVVSVVGIILTAVLLLLAFSTSLMSWWDWHDRKKINHLVAKNGNGNGH